MLGNRYSTVRFAGHRSLSTGTVIGLAAIAIGLVGTAMTTFGAPVWARLAIAGVIAALAGASELDKANQSRLQKRAAEQKDQADAAAAEATWLRSARQSLREWPLPRIADADTRSVFELALPALQNEHPRTGPLPTYIPRDRDQSARNRLRERGNLLLIGAPASGVTRTAYEIALVGAKGTLVLSPRPDTGLRRALEELDILARITPPARLLLWLDRMEQFLPDGLSAQMLRECRERLPGLRVIATIATSQYPQYAASSPELFDELGTPVTLERLPSSEEANLARQIHPGLDVTEGIAAAFTAAGSLMVRLRGGFSTCVYEPSGGDCSLARAVIEGATSWSRTDTPRGLSRSGLLELVRGRLATDAPPDSAHLAQALQWAESPVPEGAVLLTISESGKGSPTVSANAQVTAILDAEGEPVSDHVWSTALKDAEEARDSEAVGRIGYGAHIRGHPQFAFKAWSGIRTVDEAATPWLMKAAEYSAGRGDPTAELPLRQRLLQLSEDTGCAPVDVIVAAALKDLGIAWRNFGEPLNALNCHERALRLCEKLYGLVHFYVADALTNLGHDLDDLGEPGKARDCHERALHIFEKKYGPNHPDVAKALSNLGGDLLDLGEPGQALDCYQRALSILEEVYGPNHPNVEVLVTNLGNAWRGLKEPGKARDCHERALRIDMEQYGPNHPRVAQKLGNLGNAWIDLGQPRKARDCYQRALLIFEKRYGPNHPDVAKALINLGVACSLLGEPRKAQEFYDRALRILEKRYGPNHLELASLLTNLGGSSARLGERTRARNYYNRALHIARDRLPPDHPLIKDIEANLRLVESGLIAPENGHQTDPVYLPQRPPNRKPSPTDI